MGNGLQRVVDLARQKWSAKELEYSRLRIDLTVT